MKKILIALAISGCFYTGAEAQSLQQIINGLTQYNNAIPDDQGNNAIPAKRIIVCEKSSNKVCRMGADHKVECYNTMYNENFSVCKGNNGYYICCENPGYGNSTHPPYVIITPGEGTTYSRPSENTYYIVRDRGTGNGVSTETYTDVGHDADYVNPTVPQSQSYTSSEELKREQAYLANYNARHYARVCYVGDNVAENSRAPYLGCPSPQDDGPERNRERNINVSTPDVNAPLAPVTGRPE